MATGLAFSFIFAAVAAQNFFALLFRRAQGFVTKPWDEQTANNVHGSVLLRRTQVLLCAAGIDLAGLAGEPLDIPWCVMYDD